MEKSQSYTFKAETKQLLNILIHSLYKDKEVFLRELLSNASDALNRLKFELLTNQNIIDPDAELKIKIETNTKKKTITISDNGIGMDREEIINNLGTIAQSGARNFIDLAKQQNTDITQMIGQFGVGFYSVFMVADKVTVTSRSYRPDAQAVRWEAEGDETFNVSEAEKSDRGTRIEIHLKNEFKEFTEEFRIKEIIKKHSDFIGFPIFVGSDEKQANQQSALWRTPKKEIEPEKYSDFYRQFTLDFEEPIHTFHNVTDAPVQLYSLLFVPGKAERSMFSLRKEDGLKLYSRNILIDEYNKDLLPEYLRFIQGIIDSEDLPLNVSRETIQSSGLLPGLKKVLTNLVFKELESIAKKDSEKYNKFWREFGPFLKQGISMNADESKKIFPLLRFHTSLKPEDWNTLDEIVERADKEQKIIHYLLGDDPRSILHSPHLDYFKKNEIEVILLSEPIDSFMLMGMESYKDYQLKNIATAQKEEPKNTGEDNESKAEELIPEDEKMLSLFKEVLGDRVANVTISKSLSSSVARLVDADGAMNPEMQRVYRYLGKEFEQPKKVLEINKDHALIRGILSQEDEGLKHTLIEQVFDSAAIIDGYYPDPAKLVERIQTLMGKVIE
ncbi:MAG TPA: molecular chaperone HtpG [Anaerolineales bacterium]|nr:molecular chaperone HtpG [Anaerolineales bacterium]